MEFLKCILNFSSKGNANSRHYRYSCQKYSAHIKTPTLGKFINTEVLESFLQIRPRNHHYTTVPCFTICLQNWEPMAIRTEKISPSSYSSIWTTVHIVACLNRNSSTNSSFVSISQKHDFALLSKNLKLGIQEIKMPSLWLIPRQIWTFSIMTLKTASAEHGNYLPKSSRTKTLKSYWPQTNVPPDCSKAKSDGLKPSLRGWISNTTSHQVLLHSEMASDNSPRRLLHKRWIRET